MANKTETDIDRLQNNSDVTPTIPSLKTRKLPSWMTSSSSKEPGKEVRPCLICVYLTRGFLLQT